MGLMDVLKKIVSQGIKVEKVAGAEGGLHRSPVTAKPHGYGIRVG
ncbi:hypothetical protein FF011L_41360 [Roseimaritima multifibrata]|uniref:Uncharacterized protein n=1 Tax=Roseimaritima multifibrata TaxID=1930274 RepID=A0A517MKC5_9BACT|nr:hypothetical protein FF011L_41360 [Roseimaritima multifibrata]